MENSVEITAFLVDKADETHILGRIRKIAGVQEVIFISKEAALREFTQDKELRELIEIIGQNPLPLPCKSRSTGKSG